jgi:hypothetical protein
MVHPIAQRLFELLTGTPYITTRSMAAEFGPTLATRYPELAQRSDWELLVRDLREVVAEIEALRTASPATADAIERVKRVLEVTR